MPLSEVQLRDLQTVERIASCFSLAGTIFIFITFVCSPDFRRPINRLVFYASWGNTLGNIATLISESGIRAGRNSPLCQFQGFLIQMFIPADAFWNLAMAYNVYLTLYRKYDAQQLKALEWRYHILCYGCPFIIAIVLLCIETNGRGKIYGPATLWCWVSVEWEYLRIALCYGPAWVCIMTAFTIYLLSGRQIFKNRRALQAVADGSGSRSRAGAEETGNSMSSFKETNIAVTSDLKEAVAMTELANVFDQRPVTPGRKSSVQFPTDLKTNANGNNVKSYGHYSVRIDSTGSRQMSRSGMPDGMLYKRKAAMEVNRAAWGYTKVALLFFVSLLVTWVPSSANRVWALAHPGQSNVGLAYVAGIVLSLMGFWNSVIYIVTSRAACKALILTIFARGYATLRPVQQHTLSTTSSIRRTRQQNDRNDEFERLGERNASHDVV